MEIIFFRKSLIKVKIQDNVLLHYFNSTPLLAFFFEFTPTQRRTAASLLHLIKLLSSLKFSQFSPTHFVPSIISFFKYSYLLFYHGELEILVHFMQVLLLLAISYQQIHFCFIFSFLFIWAEFQTN